MGAKLGCHKKRLFQCLSVCILCDGCIYKDFKGIFLFFLACFIYNESITEQTEVCRRFEENVEVRDRIQNECEITESVTKVKQQRKRKKLPPWDPIVDPLVISNG